MKMLTVVGARPQFIKAAAISRAIRDQYTNSIEEIIVHTGQNYDYELNEIFFNDLDVRKPDYFLNSVGRTTAETIGNILIKSEYTLFKLFNQ
jgi:UDP-N-acetylglucosamine 2-epimerase (non-hydrolysing)